MFGHSEEKKSNKMNLIHSGISKKALYSWPGSSESLFKLIKNLQPRIVFWTIEEPKTEEDQCRAVFSEHEQGHWTHGLTVAMVACIRPTQDHASQTSIVDKEGLAASHP